MGPAFCAEGLCDIDGWHSALIPLQQCVSANTTLTLQPGSTRVLSPSERLETGCVLAQAPWQALAELMGGGLPVLLCLSGCLSPSVFGEFDTGCILFLRQSILFCFLNIVEFTEAR